MKPNKFLTYFFLVIGFAFSVGFFFSITHQLNKINNYHKTDGIVVDLIKKEATESYSRSSNQKYVYSPVVKFQDSYGLEHQFTESVASYPPSFEIGEHVEVLYDPLNPQSADINSTFFLWFVPFILGIFAFSFLLFGIIFFALLKTKNINKYKKNGIAVRASIVDIKLMDHIKINGKHPYRIYAKWEDKAYFKSYEFVSDNLYFDPTNKLESNEITVYYLKDNPKKYAMDLSHITN